jgi:secondary thiamine-phosphate synthase enzyme
MSNLEIKHTYITVMTQNAGEYYDITDDMIAYSLHTTTGLVVNEGSDPGVGKDVSEILWKLVPESRNWKHTEESPLDSAAHVKAQLIGNSIFLGVEKGKIVLGEWQRVYFIEYIESRERKVFTMLLGTNNS